MRPNLLYISWDLTQYLTPNQIQQIEEVPKLQSAEQVKYNIHQNLLRDFVPVNNSSPSYNQQNPNLLGFNGNSNSIVNTNSNNNIKQIQYTQHTMVEIQIFLINNRIQHIKICLFRILVPNVGNPNINQARSIKDYKPTGRIIL